MGVAASHGLDGVYAHQVDVLSRYGAHNVIADMDWSDWVGQDVSCPTPALPSSVSMG